MIGINGVVWCFSGLIIYLFILEIVCFCLVWCWVFSGRAVSAFFGCKVLSIPCAYSSWPLLCSF